MGKKSTSRFAVGSTTRVVHVNLRELHLEKREAYAPEIDSKFPAHIEDELKTLLPNKVVKELRWSCFEMRMGMPYFLGYGVKANSPDGVVDRLGAVANLADGLLTVLSHVKRSRVGNLLVAHPYADDPDDKPCRFSYWDLESALSELLVRACTQITKIEERRAQLPRRTGRLPSTPTGPVGQIAAIVAAYGRMQISKSPDSPFMRVCELMWEAMDLGPKTPRHAVETFVKDLAEGKTYALAHARWSPRYGIRRGFLIEPSSRPGKFYQVRIIKDMYEGVDLVEVMMGKRTAKSTGKAV